MLWYTMDFETKSRVDLFGEGLDNYVSCPDFDAIALAVLDRQTGERVTGTVYGDCPLSVEDILYPLLEDPEANFIAHNATFEYVVCCHLAKKWGLPEPALERFWCSSLPGSAIGLPVSLDKQANAVLGLNKVEEGKSLIRLFCVPSKDGTFNTPHTHPEKWAEFLYYMETDVDLADELWDACPGMTDEIRQFWLATVRMNLRGYEVDMEVVNQVLHDVDIIKADAEAVTKSITNGLVSKPTQRKKLLDFINSRGLEGSSLTSKQVMKWIEDESTPDDIKDLLAARLSVAKSTFGKYLAFRRYVSADGRSRHSFWASGTHTGRLAGKGVQPQNITYDKLGRFPSAAKLLVTYKARTWPDHYDKAEALVCMTRAVIKSPFGMMFYIVDYSSIEARIQCWLANVQWALRKYERNEDLYKPMAAVIFGIKVEDVTKELRNGYGKITVLGCGYGMGPNKFSVQYSMDIDEAKRCVYAYRNTYSEIKTYWTLLEDAFKACLLMNRKTKAQANKAANGMEAPIVRFRPETVGGVHYIVCTPPGNRDIWYREPKLSADGELSYERKTGKTTFRMKLWGGILFENICQNIAGVIIGRGMLKVETLFADPVLQIHDELVCEVKPCIDVQVLDNAMVDIHGFPGLPLAVESYLATRFSK